MATHLRLAHGTQASFGARPSPVRTAKRLDMLPTSPS
ncbi:MAG: hypothetical protein LBS94_03785 [Prevotellaceae bacterium]|nr:hypothetical protein [Prevotellaceae bacterium]